MKTVLYGAEAESTMICFPAAEQQVQLAATERRREDYEEQRNEYENHVEEVRDGKTSLWLVWLTTLRNLLGL